MLNINYVPILKWKQGEQFALMNLEDNVKSKITPLVSITRNPDSEKFVQQLKRFWGNKNGIYVGLNQKILENGSIPITQIMESIIQKTSNEKIKVMPVVSTYNSKAYLEMLNKNSKYIKNGALLHLKPHDFKKIREIDSYIKRLSGLNEIDLLIDLYTLNVSFEISIYVDILLNIISEAKKIGYRKIIFAASSFPEVLSGYRAYSKTPIERIEWSIWKKLHNQSPDIIFGDYCIDDPIDLDFSGGVTIVPTIRYTRGDNWHIVRGEHDPRRPRDFSQFHKLSQMLIKKSDIYCDSNYSWGDRKIYECANTSCSGQNCNHGNLTSWVKINANHHLTYVANQVANYPSA